MKRKRTWVREIEPTQFSGLLADPVNVPVYLVQAGLKFPTAAKFIMAAVRNNRPELDVRFYADDETFFEDYAGCILRDAGRSASNERVYFSFMRAEDGQWILIVPPTVIGVGLKSRLR